MKAGTRVLVSLSLCVVMATMIASLTTHAAQKAATVLTDLSDYPPGTQVNVSGSGWLAGEVVQLTFTETATTPPGGYMDGPFVFYATADGLGNIANGDFYTDQHDVGVTFLLTAVGSISGRTSQTTFTDNLAGIFEIDGNTKVDFAAPSHDWNQVYADYLVRIGQATGTGTSSGTGSIQFTTDGVNSATDDSFSNSPKDTQDITAWKWTRKAVSSPKTDLEHGLGAAYQQSGYGPNCASSLPAIVPCGDTHTLLFIGTDRYASGSNSAMSVWFLQHPIGAKPDGTFINKSDGSPEKHVDGDLLIQADLGNPPSVTAYQWKSGALQPITLSSAQYTKVLSSATVAVPWSFNDTSGSSSPLAQEFFEVGLDLNEIFHATNANLPDFSTFIITSRTSNSQTATLADFILGNLSSAPDIAVDKAADAATVAAGGQVGYKVTVRNVGVGDVTGATLSDPLPGTGLNWSLASDSTPGVFQIDGGTLKFASSFSGILPNNSAPLVAHVVATSQTTGLGKLHNVATVAAVGETVDFQSNNTYSADIVVVPVAVNDSYTMALNGTLNVPANGVRSNDGAPLTDFTSVLVLSPTHGSLTTTLAADGSFTYKPNTGYFGSDSFTYKDVDIFGNSSLPATVTINIGNNAPVAANDSYTVDEDGTLTVPASGVLSNDSDADGNSLTVAAPRPITAPSHGTLTLNSDGSFTYKPAANYNGPDSFTYQATDGAANSTPATVSITVNPVNDAPVAANDTATTNEDTAVTIAVLTNDSDVDGDSLSAVKLSDPSHGTVILNADGTFTYTPAANYNGSDSFTYKACDNAAPSLCSGVATVTITVSAVNDAPVAVNDSATTNEDTAVTIAVLNNDSDVDGDPLTSAKVTDPAHGTVTHNANGTFTYTPAANYNGGDSFTYKACDNGSPSLCSTATVSITINAVNDAPSNVVVNNDALDENSVYDLSGSFVDPDSGDIHTVTINWGDGSGDKIISLGVGVFAFSASHPYLDDPSGTPDNYTVSVSVSDGTASGGGSAKVTVNNVAPIVVMSPSPITLSVGDAFSRPGSFFDPGTLDTWSATVDYGDGGAAQPLTLNADNTFGLSSPAYTTAGVYTVTVSVTDKDGGVGTQSFQVSVGVPPVAIDHIDNPAAIAKNSLLSATFTFTGSLNSGYTSSINWGDASAGDNVLSGTATTDGSGQGAVSGSHTYAHNGTYKVFVTVTDSATHVSDTKSFTVTVQTP